jgi:hypothetical protein
MMKTMRMKKKVGLISWPLLKNLSMMLCYSDQGTRKEVLLIICDRNKALTLQDLVMMRME